MDEQIYWAYCVADETFFDAPDRMSDTDNRFVLADRPAPSGWQRGEQDLWVGLEPPVPDRPIQGWKIHVSVTIAEAVRCLDIVWDYCVAHQLGFKFLRSRDAMMLVNAKYATRGTSGKLVTLYPRDEAQFAQALSELSESLAGMAGPYVLGDLRIGDGPLYVRYGAFAEMWCQGEGDVPVLAIKHPKGNLVPDRRGPVFAAPAWVEIPEVLRPHLEALRSDSGANFPYQVEEALHFSNAGGVYLARDSFGTRVVLREARPHAGLDRHGTGAVARLGRERATLDRLAGLDCVPRVLDYHVVHGHHFLVEEHIEGMSLLRAVQTSNPSTHPEPTPEQIAEYRDWAVDVLDKVAEALKAVHARGIRFGDLHPSNVLLRPDGAVVLIDFEFSADLADESPPGLGAPGFMGPANLTGAALDLYALACLRLFMFMMLTPLIDLDRAKLATLVGEARRTEDMPAPLAAEVTHVLSGANSGSSRDEAAELFVAEPPGWPRIRDSLVAGIHASVTPDRLDRLFPGGPPQFQTGGFGIAHGAAGVLLALHRVGAMVPEGYITWLVEAVKRAPVRPPDGLFTGPHGVAAVLDTLGRRDEALEILELAHRFDGMPSSTTLYGGTAGRALNLLHFARVTNDHSLRDTAIRVGDELAALVVGRAEWPGGYGLLRGPSGLALLFLHLHAETGEPGYLDLTCSALRHDLDRGAILSDGTFQLRDGTRNLLYLDGGSGGVGLVLHEYLRRREDRELERVLAAIRRGCRVPFVYQPGLFTGRAGFIAIMAQIGVEDDEPALREHVRRLAWYALFRDRDLVFPGEQLMRLSMDLAMGSAGVLLALHAAFEGTTAFLPYLDTRSPRVTVRQEGGDNFGIPSGTAGSGGQRPQLWQQLQQHQVGHHH